jgi:capsular polysaccharide transport system ATP-binding protein
MIALRGVSKVVTIGKRKQVILGPTDLDIPSDRHIALLGPSEQEKRVLVDLLTGVALPTRGVVRRDVKVSFPVGYSGAFTAEISVRQNVEFAARLHGADVETVCDFVRQMSGLGAQYDKPLLELAPEHRVTLAQILTYAIPFDVYVHYGDLNRGPKKFRPVMQSLYRGRAREAGTIMPTRNFAVAREYCDMAMILHQGRLFLLDEIEQAIALCKGFSVADA